MLDRINKRGKAIVLFRFSLYQRTDEDVLGGKEKIIEVQFRNGTHAMKKAVGNHPRV